MVVMRVPMVPSRSLHGAYVKSGGLVRSSGELLLDHHLARPPSKRPTDGDVVLNWLGRLKLSIIMS
jgi:hypothetical protein